MENELDQYGDLNLDDVFPNPEGVSDPSRTVAPPAVEADPAPVVTQTEPYLRTSTGTVYKSAEDAVKGVEHKDQLIARLRQDAIDRTGTDPVTGQPVQRTPAHVNYTQDGTKFLSDLKAAAEKGDTQAYIKVQEKFVQDVLAPYAPVITGFAKSQAIENVATEIADFRQFVQSDDMRQTLDANPLLKNAISTAEATPAMSNDLGEFYKMAYRLNVARKVPEMARGQQQAPPVTRPTVSSSTLPATPSQQGRGEAPGLGSSEARRALIQAQERAGVAELRF